jgi:hypothetical protein
MRVQGLDPRGQPLELGPQGSLVVDAERDVRATGSGFAAGSRAVVYLNPPVRPGTTRSWWRDIVDQATKTKRLGTFTVAKDGTFAGRARLPQSVPMGDHVVQVVGVAPDGTTRALTVGLRVQPWITVVKLPRRPIVRAVSGSGSTVVTPRGDIVPTYDQLRVRGDSGGLAAGTVLTAYLRFSGKKAFVKAATTVKVRANGTFTWSRKIKAGKALAVYIAWQDTKSNTVRWPRTK